MHCNDAISHVPNPNSIFVHGARENNLKNICFEIPKGKLVALTGPSGSGKSSIATDILQKECIRQYLESLGMITDHIEKAKIDSIMGLSPSIGVTQRVTDFNPRSTVGTKSGILTILRNMFAAMGHQRCTGCGNFVKQPLQDKQKLTVLEFEEEKASGTKKITKSYFECHQCGHQLEKLKMHHFSSNALAGACETCKGAGRIICVDLELLLDQEKTLQDGAVNLWNEGLAKYYVGVILAASTYYNFPFDPLLTLKEYSKEQKDILLYGIHSPDFVRVHKHIQPPKKVSDGNFEGIIPHILNLYKKNPEKVSKDVKKYVIEKSCIECNSAGLSRLAREVTIAGKTLIEVSGLNLSQLLDWLEKLNQQIAPDEVQVLNAVQDALKKRIQNLIDVGLEYVTLQRTLPSLSAGESQRVRLAGLLGSGLTGVLYVFDEPTTGLHPHDNVKLLKTIKLLQEAGNTILIIEHDMAIVQHADYILDIGPGGGTKGGNVVIAGTPKELMACAASVTGKYLAVRRSIPVSRAQHQNKILTIRGARENNLQNIDVHIPIHQLVVMTGVSGSGKSTLLFDILDKAARRYFNNASETPGKHTSIEGFDNFSRVVTVDQITIGSSKSTRSNVATYTKLFDAIRDVFASLPESKKREYSSDKFSFNTSSERCQNCNGAGVVDVDMTFMPDIETECPLCNGMRFTEELLSIHFKGYSIAQILEMSVLEALPLFQNEKKIYPLLEVMRQVGLDYLKLGQSTNTLSGGEAQRLKLAAELAKSEQGTTLYLLDEPTTGLHPQEVDKLLHIFRALVSNGNTVVIIEHNLDVMCNADTLIDFGPKGGHEGGLIVAQGTPEEVMNNQNSVTGQCLKEYLAAYESF